MSKENVTKFLSGIDQDERDAIKEAVGGSDDPADTVAAIVSVASDQGDDFTADEFVEVMTSIQRHLSGELSDDDLEVVVGGLGQAVGQMASISPRKVMGAAEEIFISTCGSK